MEMFYGESSPVPDERDATLHFPRSGGIFSNQVCFSFSVHIHDLVRAQIRALEHMSGHDKATYDMLVNRLLLWTRDKLLCETDAWLRACPVLGGMFKFTMTEMIRQYAEVFPEIKRMGIRLIPLSDFVYALLMKVYEDPCVCSGRFGGFDHNRTFAIVSQRLNATLCETLKILYFPKFCPATSALWKLEPQVMDGWDVPGVPIHNHSSSTSPTRGSSKISSSYAVELEEDGDEEEEQ